MVKQSIRVTRADAERITELLIQDGSKKTILTHYYDSDGFLSMLEVDGKRLDLPTLAQLLSRRQIDVRNILSIESIRLAETVEPRLLSSISRTGRVYWQDKFDNYTAAMTEKWQQNQGTISLDDTVNFSSKLCGKLTTAAVAGAKATAGKGLGLQPKQKFGIELWWHSQSTTPNLRSFRVEFRYLDGTNMHTGEVLWQGTVGGVATQKWRYLDNSGVYVDIPSGAQPFRIEAADTEWNHAKLIINMNNHQYGRFVSNEKTFDLNGIPLKSESNLTVPTMIIYVICEAETATAVVVNVSDIIFTLGE